MKGLFIVMALLYGVNVYSQNTDFSGRYGLNKEKTDLSGMPEGTLPENVSFKQESKKLIINRVFIDEPAPICDTLLFDGSPFTKKINDSINLIITLKSLSNISLLIERKFYTNGNVVGFVEEIWNLHDNGKVLSFKRNIEQAKGVKYSITGYFDRQ